MILQKVYVYLYLFVCLFIVYNYLKTIHTPPCPTHYTEMFDEGQWKLDPSVDVEKYKQWFDDNWNSVSSNIVDPNSPLRNYVFVKNIQPDTKRHSLGNNFPSAPPINNIEDIFNLKLTEVVITDHPNLPMTTASYSVLSAVHSIPTSIRQIPENAWLYREGVITSISKSEFESDEHILTYFSKLRFETNTNTTEEALVMYIHGNEVQVYDLSQMGRVSGTGAGARTGGVAGLNIEITTAGKIMIGVVLFFILLFLILLLVFAPLILLLLIIVSFVIFLIMNFT